MSPCGSAGELAVDVWIRRTPTVPSHRADTPQPRSRREQRQKRNGRRTTHRAKGSSLTAPQLGIASALGLATVVAPLSGMMSSSGPAKATENQIAMPRVAAPAFGLRERAATAVEQLQLIPDDADDSYTAVPGTLTAPRNLLVTRPSRGGERAVLPNCFGEVPLVKAANGELPKSMLCTLWDGKHQLRADAAVSLAKLNVAYTATFGHPLCVSDAYRTVAQQFAIKAQKGYLAATPRTSVHGLGRAVDLCDGVQDTGSRTYRWLVDNAPRYGWVNPDWARPGGNGPNEPWHWEFNCGAEAGCEPSSLPDGE
jgi:zinc D-Ala-D-Ala carboxypeptidase